MTAQHKRPLVALVTAVEAAIAPAEQALGAVLPDAQLWNIVDDRLLEEAGEQGGVTPKLEARMERLIRHAVLEGADAILVTCSMYGSVANQLSATIGIPLFAPDDALFAEAVSGKYRSVLLIAPAAGPLADGETRLAAAAHSAGVELTISGAVADGAASAARSGDIPALARAQESAYRSSGATVDAIVLGQYSISPAATALAEITGLPVLAGPALAAGALRDALQELEAKS